MTTLNEKLDLVFDALRGTGLHAQYRSQERR
jgi:hypothetical protein